MGMATVHIMHGQVKKQVRTLVLSAAIAPCLKAVLLAGSQIKVEAFCQRISAKCGSMATQQSTTKTAARSLAHQTQTLPGGLSLGPSTGWGVLGLGCPCLDCMLNTLVSPWSQVLMGLAMASWTSNKSPDTHYNHAHIHCHLTFAMTHSSAAHVVLVCTLREESTVVYNWLCQ